MDALVSLNIPVFNSGEDLFFQKLFVGISIPDCCIPVPDSANHSLPDNKVSEVKVRRIITRINTTCRLNIIPFRQLPGNSPCRDHLNTETEY